MADSTPAADPLDTYMQSHPMDTGASANATPAAAVAPIANAIAAGNGSNPSAPSSFPDIGDNPGRYGVTTRDPTIWERMTGASRQIVAAQIQEHNAALGHLEGLTREAAAAGDEAFFQMPAVQKFYKALHMDHMLPAFQETASRNKAHMIVLQHLNTELSRSIDGYPAGSPEAISRNLQRFSPAALSFASPQAGNVAGQTYIPPELLGGGGGSGLPGTESSPAPAPDTAVTTSPPSPAVAVTAPPESAPEPSPAGDTVTDKSGKIVTLKPGTGLANKAAQVARGLQPGEKQTFRYLGGRYEFSRAGAPLTTGGRSVSGGPNYEQIARKLGFPTEPSKQTAAQAAQVMAEGRAELARMQAARTSATIETTTEKKPQPASQTEAANAPLGSTMKEIKAMGAYGTTEGTKNRIDAIKDALTELDRIEGLVDEALPTKLPVTGQDVSKNSMFSVNSLRALNETPLVGRLATKHAAVTKLNAAIHNLQRVANSYGTKGVMSDDKIRAVMGEVPDLHTPNRTARGLISQTRVQLKNFLANMFQTRTEPTTKATAAQAETAAKRTDIDSEGWSKILDSLNRTEPKTAPTPQP